VKPPPFDYSCPDTLEGALDILAEVGDEARPLAGGQSLIPLLSLRLARPAHLVDLAGIAPLRTVEAVKGSVRLGAMVREHQAEADPEVRRRAPLLAEALPLIGHPAIRSRGTIGGSLSHADPAAELPAVALVVDAELVAQSRDRGRRSIPAAEFFTGFFSTALEPDEILTDVLIEAPGPATGWAIDEVARRHGDFAMVGAAVMVRIEADAGRIAEVRIALTGVSDTPVRAAQAEQLLVGAAPSGDLWAEAAQQAGAELDPPADLHGSSAYRRHLAVVLVRRTLVAAAERAREAA
jgi:carbon-monoxide dehydrogenase medium subunit